MEHLSNRNQEKPYASQKLLANTIRSVTQNTWWRKPARAMRAVRQEEAARTLGYIGWTLEGLEALKLAEEVEQE